MGNLSLPGGKRRPCSDRGKKETGGYRRRRQEGIVFCNAVSENRGDRHSQHFAAEFYFHRKHYDPGRDQWIWPRGDCRIFCCREIE